MHLRAFVAAAALGTLTITAGAQETPDHPVEVTEEYQLDTGEIANNTARAKTAYAQVIHVRDSGWLRLYFGDVVLNDGSFVRITSMLDLDQQILDSNMMKMWQNSTAYFNGDTLLLELVAAPQSAGNRLTISEVGRFDLTGHTRGGGGQCGICGGTDDRVPSSEEWSCRLFPAGCTASVFNDESCLVSAGHCIGGNMVIQFNVPNSFANCSTANPPASEQFPIIQHNSVNGGVGNDWAVMRSGTNFLGETPYDRYVVFRPLATTGPAVNQNMEMYGYGVDNTCTLSQTQQFHFGPITQVFGTYFRYSVDLRGGNSGSGLIRNGEILGVATHCPCPNYATRIDHFAFSNAIENMCPDAPDLSDVWIRRAIVKIGQLVGGDTDAMRDSDNIYHSTDSIHRGNRDRAWIQITAKDDSFGSISHLDVNLESRISVAGVALRVWLRDWNTGTWVQIADTVGTTTDSVISVTDVPNPNNYYQSDGRIRLRVDAITTTQGPFTLDIDHAEILVAP